MGESAAGGVAESMPLVADDETVCRLCYKAGVPITVDQQFDDVDPASGRLRAVQISKQDLTIRGFSLQRVAMYSRQIASDEPARRERDRKEKGKERAGFVLQGVLLGNVEQIHAVRGEGGEPIFRVYATPNDASAAHAEVKLAPGVKGSQYIKWRVVLADILGTLQPVHSLPSVPRSLPERVAHIFREIFGRVRRA